MQQNICFDGNCVVAMDNGTQKLVKDIMKGDNVLGGKIEAILRIKTVDNKMKYCETQSGLLINDYHPIIIEDKFVYPCVLYNTNDYDSEYMYSFLLEKNNDEFIEIKRDNSLCIPLTIFGKLKLNNQIINERPKYVVINNIQVLTLAHNIDNSMISHDFFGTEKIVNRLKKCKGWDSGLITFQDNENLFVKDKNDKIIDINIMYEL